MNLDAVSAALAQIPYTVKNLSKNNFKSSQIEIANVNLVVESVFLHIQRHLSLLAHS